MDSVGCGRRGYPYPPLALDGRGRCDRLAVELYPAEQIDRLGLDVLRERRVVQRGDLLLSLVKGPVHEVDQRLTLVLALGSGVDQQVGRRRYRVGTGRR